MTYRTLQFMFTLVYRLNCRLPGSVRNYIA